MRFMVILKASEDSEAGIEPDGRFLTQMLDFEEELVKAGVLLSGEGLHPSARGKRVRFAGGRISVTDGPFSEPSALVAGFWLWELGSMDQAVEWVRRCPSPAGIDVEIEIRQVFEGDDFGPEFSPGLREQEERLRRAVAWR